MFVRCLCICFIFAVKLSAAQIYDKPVYEIEKERHLSFFYKLQSNYLSDTNINLVYYKLNLQITSDPDYLKGEVTISSTSRVSILSNIFYDLSNHLTVDSVTSNNKQLIFSHSQDKILITLNTLAKLDEMISLTIFYRGVPVPTGFGSFIFGSHNNKPAIWTLSEPFGSSDWFPCKNVIYEKADSSDVWLKCSADLTAVSNGTLTGIENNSDGTLTYKWHNSYPIVTYLISLAISDYTLYNGFFRYSQNDSMPITNYIYPENLEALKPQLDKTEYMLELFSQKFGLYPFIKEKYGHAEFGRLAGMEHQTISSMGVFNDNIMAHELTHQWFGDKITCKDWQNIWLNEGFATYGEAIFQESANGKDAYNEFIKFRMADAKTATGSIYVQDVNSISQIFSGNRSYAKGCAVLHMLRGIAGDSTFFKILKTYASDSVVAYKTATTDDFQKIAENIYGQNLDYFFQQWIFGENYPVYNVSWTTENLGAGEYRALLNIVQDINSDPEFFTMPLQIKIFTSMSDTNFNVFNNFRSQSWSFTFRGEPVDYKIDPDNWILKDVKGNDVVPVNFILEQNYPNPFNPGTSINYTLGKPSFTKISVYNILGQELKILRNETQREGNYTVNFDASGLPSGVYFYNFEARDLRNINLLFTDSKKMILIR